MDVDIINAILQEPASPASDPDGIVFKYNDLTQNSIAINNKRALTVSFKTLKFLFNALTLYC